MPRKLCVRKPATADLSKPLSVNFADYDKSQWLPVHGYDRPSAGRFTQEKDYIINWFPKGTSEEDIFHCRENVGYAMRFLKDVAAKDGRIDVDMTLYNRAAPTICFRAQHNGEIHKKMCCVVVWNQSTKGKKSYGVALWKWLAKKKPSHWKKIAFWTVPIQRGKRIKLGVEFKDEAIRIILNGREIGGMNDAAPLGVGKIGIWAIEGPVRFYSFRFTPLSKGQ